MNQTRRNLRKLLLTLTSNLLFLFVITIFSPPPEAWAVDNYFSDNVGIGMTAPNARLDIKGTGTTAGFALRIADSTPTDRLVVLDNGNVGIGNTAPAQLLHVSTSPSRGLVVTTAGYVGIGLTAPAQLLHVSTSPSRGLVVTTAGNVGIGLTNPAALLHVSTSSSAGLVVTTAGNVGIGTTGPGAKLQIGLGSASAIDIAAGIGPGASNVFSAVSSQTALQTVSYNLAINEGSRDTKVKFFLKDNTGLNGAWGLWLAWDGGNGWQPFVIGSGNLERFRIDGNSGNVGIGTTGAGSKLNVGSNVSIGVDYAGIAAPSNGVIIQGNVGIGTTAPYGLLQVGTAPTNPGLIVTTTNNVGIGTTNPGAKLEVVGDSLMSGSNRYLNFGTTVGSDGYGFRDNGGTLQYKNSVSIWADLGAADGGASMEGTVNGMMYLKAANTGAGMSLITTDGVSKLNIGVGTTDNAAQLYIKGSGTTAGFALRIADSAATDRLVVLDNGNVGIGTTAPNNRIQVKDFIKFDTTSQNTLLGYQAGNALLSDAVRNLAIGEGALFSTTTGDFNAAIGDSALYANDTGGRNIAIGFEALRYNTSGSFNNALGFNAMWSNTTGQYNVAMGRSALLYNTTGSSNVALGYEAGYNETGSQKLYIATGQALSSALVYGEFSNRKLNLLGDVTVANPGSLGSEKVSNPNFTTVPDTSWTSGWGTGWTHDTTNLEADHTAGNTAALEQNILAVAGEVYYLSFVLKNRTAGSVTPQIGGVNGTAVNNNVTSSQMITATGSGNLKFTPSSDFDGTIDTVTVKKVTGGNLAVVNLITGGGTSGLKIDATGNVGIGNTAPYGLLQVGTAPTNPGLIVTTTNNVGIGTTNPGAKLEVAGDSLMSGSNRYLNFGTTVGSGGYGFYDNGGTLQFKNSGGSWTNLGAGGGGASMEGTVNGIMYLKAANTGAGMSLITTDGVSKLNIGVGTTDNASQLYIKGSGTSLGFALRIANSTPTDRLVVLDNGNVGIGLTNPSNTLQVNGSLRAGAMYGNFLNISAPANNSMLYGTAGLSNNDYYAIAPTVTVSNSSGGITGGMKITITDSTTSTGGFRGIFVNTGALSAATGVKELMNLSTDSSPVLVVQASGNVGIGNTAPYGLLQVGTAPTNPGLIVTTTNNVGIGTTAPKRLLHVSAGTGESGLFERAGATSDAPYIATYTLATKTTSMNNGFGSGIEFNIQDDAGVINNIGFIGAVRAGADNTGDIIFAPRTSGAYNERMRITSAGNVGIGTISPVAKLDLYTTGTGTNLVLRIANTSTADLLSVLDNGNVGIGTTAPSEKLEVNGNIALGENGLVLDAAISADGKYSGITEAGTAGATLAFGDLVYLQTADSRWELADANLSAGYDKKLGICVLAAANDGDATTILLWGKVNAATAFPALTIGAPAYMSETAGDVVVAQPTTADAAIRVVGYGNTADELFFCPSTDYITHT